MPLGLPSQALVPGVPFISFEDARDWERDDHLGMLNPSIPASMGMIWKYWGRELATLFDEEDEAAESDWVVEGGQAENVDILKQFICRGVPIGVSVTALTPYAHPIAELMSGHSFENEGPFSGVLGRMLALETIQELEGKVDGVTIKESVFMAVRVVIGYDDGKGVLIVHDPTFGPIWEVDYDDFEKMWEANGKMFMASHPPNYEVILDVEATPTRISKEVDATETMIERTEERFGLKPKRLAPCRAECYTCAAVKIAAFRELIRC